VDKFIQPSVRLELYGKRLAVVAKVQGKGPEGMARAGKLKDTGDDEGEDFRGIGRKGRTESCLKMKKFRCVPPQEGDTASLG